MLLTTILLSCGCVKSGTDADAEAVPSPADTITEIINASGARAGVAVICEDDTLLINNRSLYPLMSVFKLHIAAAVIHKGLPLDSIVHVPAKQLRTGTYSPMRDSVQGRETDITIDRLMYFSVAKSDNNACDILIDLVGGIDSVNSYIQSLGTGNVQLSETEETMHADIMHSYNNSSSPQALCILMSRLYAGEILSPEGTNYLIRLLKASTTGRDKLAAGLPQGSFKGHKSGLSDRTAAGMLIASGDVAAFTTRSGKQAFVAVLIKDNCDPDSTINRIFADISRVVYNNY